MRHWLLICIFILGAPCLSMGQPVNDTSPIEQDLVREVDVTGDGKADKITLHLSAKNLNSPMLWTLSIVADGKEIYFYKSDDSRMDHLFSDKGYVLGCNDYISCKKKYYYHDILDVLVLTGTKWYNLYGILDKSQPGTLYPIGRKELSTCCNVVGSQADAILNKIEKKFRDGKVIAINVLQSPVHANPPLIFIPEVGRFIRFDEE